MDLKTFELLARYNLWATQKLNQTLLLVSDDDFFWIRAYILKVFLAL